MKKVARIAAIALAAAVVPLGWAGSGQAASCYSPAAIEAEQAIRFMTELMVISSACQNTTYAEFRLRNRDQIVAYQKAMITHFRGAPAFDKWNTVIANQLASKQADINLGIFCQQSEAMLKQATTLDTPAFRALAAQKAAAVSTHYAKCGK